MKRVEEAVLCFGSGFNCSQAIISTYGKDHGLDSALALRIASGFGGGMGRQCKTCGAVTGAYMVLGLKYGYISAQDIDGKEKMYGLIREFARRFRERNQSTKCEDLLGVHLLTGDKERVTQQVKLICPKMIRDSAEILEELLKH